MQAVSSNVPRCPELTQLLEHRKRRDPGVQDPYMTGDTATDNMCLILLACDLECLVHLP
jgi:hypothetical protein